MGSVRFAPDGKGWATDSQLEQGWGSVINQAYLEEKICYVLGHFQRPGGREETVTCLFCTQNDVSCARKCIKLLSISLMVSQTQILSTVLFLCTYRFVGLYKKVLYSIV